MLSDQETREKLLNVLNEIHEEHNRNKHLQFDYLFTGGMRVGQIAAYCDVLEINSPAARAKFADCKKKTMEDILNAERERSEGKAFSYDCTPANNGRR
jgi:hypothetical protein